MVWTLLAACWLLVNYARADRVRNLLYTPCSLVCECLLAVSEAKRPLAVGVELLLLLLLLLALVLLVLVLVLLMPV